MEPIASYRAARLLPYLEYLEVVGAPVERGLRLARLPTGLAERAEISLPTIPTIGFLKWACRREGTDHLALRALQRRLRTCGLSYSDLIDEVRFSAASRLLAESDMRVLDIGLELGYPDPSQFARAFRRCAGISPREFRRQARMN